ncbi:MAG: hypothetical protein ABI431_03695 [Candidatus Tumulicola sp.]
MTVAILVGAVVGTTPAILIICVSPARSAPWRTLPFLIAGAALGFVIVGLPWSLFQATQDVPYLTLGMPVFGAMAGGAVATRFLPSAGVARPGWSIAALFGFLVGLLAGVIALAFCISGLFPRLGTIAVPSNSVYVAVFGFGLYLVAASIVFAAVIRRIEWGKQTFWKGVVAGLVASVLAVVSIVLFVFATS